MSITFFPLKPGRVMSYRTRTPAGEGSLAVETLSVTSSGERVSAQGRRTARGPGLPSSSRLFDVLIDGREVRCDGDVEFPLPALPGRGWRRTPRDYSVETLDGRIDTPAGLYESCLVVLYTVAGGDGGFGRRYYAPEMGFVYETCADEADPFETALTGVVEP